MVTSLLFLVALFLALLTPPPVESFATKPAVLLFAFWTQLMAVLAACAVIAAEGWP